MVAACAGYQESQRIAGLSASELTALSDPDICTGRLYNPGSEALLSAATARGLGDCSASHFRCTAAGQDFGSAAYTRCRRLAAPTGVVLSITGQNAVPRRTNR